MQDFEKLGLFYLGRSYDVATRTRGDDLVMYDSRDLVTHAVCVGMTGSGKTGLCLGLLEEAAIDRVPVIAIDPKGDLSNILLTFPQLRGEDFAPWVDEGEAERQGVTPAAFANEQAATWKAGLADWGQDGARIQRLRDSAEFRIYTPGSRSGIPVSILKSFDAPPPAVRDDPEALGERVATTTDSLLGLVGVDVDPMQSREHILISTIFADAWKKGENVDLGSLIPRIQDPPFGRVGVVELESFYPPKDRFELAMRLNNLLASPGFEAWTKGEPLDVDSLLRAQDGKPRVSIISIAHLGEAERMFFVSLLLNQVLGWARSQPGTSSLRALLYMDEIFGYFPPVATPPSKRPLLTLLKQARAYGLGVVLATQNPADLDYKGLSNTGTWFLGRLQAERDKMRVLEGLEGAAAEQSAGFDRAAMDKILSGLGKRTFLMHNVHDDRPQVFQTRWTLSFLRGPLTRQQIKTLMDPVRDQPAAPAVAAGETPTPEAVPPAPPKVATEQRPVMHPDVAQFFIPVRGPRPEGASLVYRPRVLGCGEVYYCEPKADVSATTPVHLLAPLSDGALTLEWPEAVRVTLTPDDLDRDPASDVPARFEPLPASASKAKSYAAWSKSFADRLYRGETLSLLKSDSQKVWSRYGESERDFRARLQQSAKEARDAEVDRLRAKYAKPLDALNEKIRRANEVIAEQEAQAQSSGLSSLVSFGSTVLGAFMGRKTVSVTNLNKAGSAIRSAGRTMKESSDVERAKTQAAALHEQAVQLEGKFRAEVRDLDRKSDPLTEPLETVALKPKKADVAVKLVALAWAPYWDGPGGATAAGWE